VPAKARFATPDLRRIAGCEDADAGISTPTIKTAHTDAGIADFAAIFAVFELTAFDMQPLR
jgi:hypothetical protein